MTSIVYPRFIGVDGSGDFVWELANGRWTWGETPYDAVTVTRERTFPPDRYIERYGPIRVKEPFTSVVETPPVPPAHVDAGGPLGKAGERGAHRALAHLLGVLDDWIKGARSNHDGLGHSSEPVGEECWTRFHPADIRNMINDAARELGVSEFPRPETPKEDQVR